MNKLLLLVPLFIFPGCNSSTEGDIRELYRVGDELFYLEGTNSAVIKSLHRSDEFKVKKAPIFLLENNSQVYFDEGLFTINDVNGNMIFHSSDRYLTTYKNKLYFLKEGETSYIYSYDSKDSLSIKNSYSFENYLYKDNEFFFMIGSKDSVFFYDEKFSLINSFESDKTKFIHYKNYNFTFVELVENVLYLGLDRTKRITSDKSYESILTVEVINDSYFFILKKGAMIYLIDEKGIVLKKDKYEEKRYRIFYVNDKPGIGSLDGSWYDVSFSNKESLEIKDQFFLPTNKSVWTEINSLGETTVHFSNDSTFEDSRVILSSINPGLIIMDKSSEKIFFNKDFKEVYRLKGRELLDLQILDNKLYLLKTIEADKNRIVTVDLITQD
ncbi:MAG: hypothetical protein ABJK11_12250 [Balneola sp.]